MTDKTRALVAVLEVAARKAEDAGRLELAHQLRADIAHLRAKATIEREAQSVAAALFTQPAKELQGKLKQTDYVAALLAGFALRMLEVK